MSKRLDRFMEGCDTSIEAETEAEVSADGAGRQRVSVTVESIRYRDLPVRSYVDAGGELLVEQTIGSDEQFDQGQSVEVSWNQDDVLAFDPAGNTAWC